VTTKKAKLAAKKCPADAADQVKNQLVKMAKKTEKAAKVKASQLAAEAVEAKKEAEAAKQKVAKEGAMEEVDGAKAEAEKEAKAEKEAEAGEVDAGSEADQLKNDADKDGEAENDAAAAADRAKAAKAKAAADQAAAEAKAKRDDVLAGEAAVEAQNAANVKFKADKIEQIVASSQIHEVNAKAQAAVEDAKPAKDFVGGLAAKLKAVQAQKDAQSTAKEFRTQSLDDLCKAAGAGVAECALIKGKLAKGNAY